MKIKRTKEGSVNKKFNACIEWWHCIRDGRGLPERQADNCNRKRHVASKGQCSSSAHRSLCTFFLLRCAGCSPSPSGTPCHRRLRRAGCTPRWIRGSRTSPAGRRRWAGCRVRRLRNRRRRMRREPRGRTGSHTEEGKRRSFFCLLLLSSPCLVIWVSVGFSMRKGKSPCDLDYKRWFLTICHQIWKLFTSAATWL